MTRFLSLRSAAVFGLIAGLAACSTTSSPGDFANQADAVVPQIDPLCETDSNYCDVYVRAAIMPELIGGLASIQRQLVYPEEALRNGVSGRVFVQFIVSTTGEVTELGITRGIGSGCDVAAYRAVKQARFKPGMLNGVPVPVKMSLPITFGSVR